MSKAPTLDQIKISQDYDENKDRMYLELRFEDVIIREFLPENYQHMGPESQKAAMSQLAQRARFRLATAVTHRNNERKKLAETRKKAKKMMKALT